MKGHIHIVHGTKRVRFSMLIQNSDQTNTSWSRTAAQIVGMAILADEPRDYFVKKPQKYART